MRGLPDGAGITGLRWSPDGARIAFSVVRGDRPGPVGGGRGQRRRPASDRAPPQRRLRHPLPLVAGQSLAHLQAHPTGRGPAPAAPRVPAGPVVQETAAEPAAAWTFQDLLRNPYDADCFEHYLTAEVARIGLDGAAQRLGGPGLIASARPSPDGAYLLVESLRRPFSYLVPAHRFPTRVEVWDVAGSAGLPRGRPAPGRGRAPGTGRRAHRAAGRRLAGRRPGHPGLDGGPGRGRPAHRGRRPRPGLPPAGPLHGRPDRAGRPRPPLRRRPLGRRRPGPGRRVVVADPPAPHLAGRPGPPGGRTAPPLRPLVRGPLRRSGVAAAAGAPRRERTSCSPRRTGRACTSPAPAPHQTATSPSSIASTSRSGQTERLWRCAAPYYEYAIDFVDPRAGRLLTRREAAAEPPNYYLRRLDRTARRRGRRGPARPR